MSVGNTQTTTEKCEQEVSGPGIHREGVETRAGFPQLTAELAMVLGQSRVQRGQCRGTKARLDGPKGWPTATPGVFHICFMFYLVIPLFF